MAYYVYTVIDHSGQIIKSSGEFTGLDNLFNALHNRGLELIKYRRVYISLDLLLHSSLKRPDLIEFFRNLSLLLKGGIPLRDAVRDMVSTTEHPLLRRIFDQVRHRLEDGLLFSEALKENNKHMPSIMIPLVTIGEETGALDKTMEDGANHLERVHEIITATKQALIYPVFVLTAMTGALVFWMVFVLPQLLELFAEMGIEELPLATRMLIFSVDFFNNWWFMLPVTIIFFALLWTISRNNHRMKYHWDLFLFKIPLVGSMIKASQLAFFFEYTAMLTAAGINIIRSMELMEESIHNQVVKEGLKVIRQKVSGGDFLSDAISALPFFEPFVLRVIRVGEQTGNMPEQMQILAKYYMTKVNRMVATMSKTLEPVIITVAGLIFMVIILGLLGPVYDLVGSM